jgi:putative hydrolase of the HAD superfamily
VGAGLRAAVLPPAGSRAVLPLAGLQAVFLDGLGTLVTLEPPWPALVRGLAHEHGVRLSGAEAERAFGAEMAYYRAHHHEGSDERALRDLRRRCAGVLRAELPQAVGLQLSIEELTVAMLGALRFRAYPDAAPALRALRKRGLRLVVVSNWDVSLPAVLAVAGLAELLDGVVTSGAVGEPKPGTAIFEAALKLVGVPRSRAVHVGDSFEHDVLGARAAGIIPVLLCRAGAEAARAPSGVPVIASLAELLA